MKFIKKYNSIKGFKEDLSNILYPCISLVFTPAGKSIGYLINSIFKFYIHNSLISENNFQTIDFTNIDEIDASEVLNLLDEFKEGDKIIFNETLANYLKGELILPEHIYWEGNSLVYGENKPYYYPYEEPTFEGLQVIYNDGSIINYDVNIIESDTILNKSEVSQVIIGDNITDIGGYAFEKCSGLTSITIPESVTNIGIYAFSNCTGLTSVTIGNSVTTIGSSAFNGCSGLTSVTIGNSVTNIGSSAFLGCTNLVSINIPNSVTTIDSRAFLGCYNLTHVTIGNGVTKIYAQAFLGTNLLSIIIPDSVSWIGAEVFDAGKTLIFTSTIPCSISSISFGNYCTIYVPDDSYKSYCQATNWINYASNIRPISLNHDYIRTVDMTGKVGIYIDTHLHPDYLDNTIVEVALGKYVDSTFDMNPFNRCVNLRKLICSNLHSRINLSMIFNDLDVNGILYTIDHWSEGASIKFSGETALYLKGEIVLNEYSCWEGNTLKYSDNPQPYYYYLDNYDVTVWLSNGSILNLTFDEVELYRDQVVKVSIHDVAYVPNYIFGSTETPNLTDITIGNVITIGDVAFCTCYEVYNIYINAINPPNIGLDSLPSNIYAIYVPSESLNKYRTATNWNRYAGKIYPIS